MGDPVATREDIARLFGRAAFGATPADLDAWTGKPYVEAVDHLLAIPDPATRTPAIDDARRLALQEVTRGNLDAGLFAREAQKWWLERMRSTPYPLEERLVLFWHDHFATRWRPELPDVGMVLQQNQLLRTYALGNFRAMCIAITLDPAMMWWLNGTQNVVGAPNENYAREFFELFALGVRPQIYTESDIREAARVLTGWYADPFLRSSTFNPAAHDAGSKTVLGETIADLGAAEFQRVIDIALSQPLSYRFVAYKLVLNLAYVPETADLIASPDPLIVQVADALRTSGWDLRAGVRALLLSDEFRYAAPALGRQSVRLPVDLVVSACKAFGVAADGDQTLNLLDRMGQVPFEPPNVGGWPSGRDWLSPVTAIARYDWGVALHAALSLTEAVLPALPPATAYDEWARRFGLAALSPNTRSALDAFLASAAASPEPERQAGVLVLLASSPDWMVI